MRDTYEEQAQDLLPQISSDNVGPQPIEDQHARRWRKPSFRSWCFVALAVGLIAISSLCFYLISAQAVQSSSLYSAPVMGPALTDFANSTLHSYTSCGSTPATARARGCQFDVMSFAWYAPLCYDSNLTAQFLAEKDWSWYPSVSITIPVLREEVLAGKHSVLYVSREYHIYHCVYMWRKLHRALNERTAVDSYIANIEHTEHCGRMLLENIDLQKETVNTLIWTKYPSCEEAYINK